MIAQYAESNPLSIEQRTTLVRQIIAESYSAEDLSALARLIYVRSLFRVFNVAGSRTDQAKPLAQILTADVLHALVGFHFTSDDVETMVMDDGLSKDGSLSEASALSAEAEANAKAADIKAAERAMEMIREAMGEAPKQAS